MPSAAEIKLVKAKVRLVLSEPFFGILATRLKPVETSEVPTAVVDGRNLFFNPKFIDTLTDKQMIGLVAHEVMHPAMLHHTRMGSRNLGKWNAACDYAINHILIDSGFELPPGGLLNDAYKNLSAEHIYTLLPDSFNDYGLGFGGVLAASPEKKDGAGSAAQEEADWKQALSSAITQARLAGKIPGHVARMVDELLTPILPWRELLRRFMTQKSNDDFSWARPNRRYIGNGLYLPNRYSEATGEIVVCIDTSGSIGQKELTEFGSEVVGIIKEVRPTKTHVLYCDAHVAHVDEFAPEDELTFAAHGGGGTDFRPPFEWVKENGLKPQCFIYLTDGYGPFPEEQGYPVLWAINNYNVTPPFGEHLVLDVKS